MNLPTLIIVTGRPGAGKTTLAHTLAHSLRFPAICRDELKEGLVHTLWDTSAAADHAALNQRVYTLFFQTIELLLHNGVSLIAEAAFQHHVWQPKLQPLHAIARMCIIVCSVDPALAQQRALLRNQADSQRAQYHPLPSYAPTAPQPYVPPQLAGVPTCTLDTSNGYAPTLDQLQDWVGQQLHRA